MFNIKSRPVPWIWWKQLCNRVSHRCLLTFIESWTSTLMQYMQIFIIICLSKNLLIFFAASNLLKMQQIRCRAKWMFTYKCWDPIYICICKTKTIIFLNIQFINYVSIASVSLVKINYLISYLTHTYYIRPYVCVYVW